jgi:hypothetical protein
LRRGGTDLKILAVLTNRVTTRVARPGIRKR